MHHHFLQTVHCHSQAISLKHGSRKPFSIAESQNVLEETVVYYMFVVF